MKTLWRPMATLFVALSLLTGVLYPLLITGIGRAAFARQAAGSLVYRDGRPIGSTLIGQNFDRPGYFWGRLSATAPMPYNGDASGGSNDGPLNPALVAAAKARIAALRAADPGNTAPVPVDLVTASGSGLDPQISPAAADYQAARVARARHLPLAEVQALIRRYTAGRQLGILGEPTVNVLALNLALDALGAKSAG
ncbi:MAG: potassium-transporting ATPase subunit KdpC [Burkholderiales bacterium]|nr:potassium-transporting ATPase subunit KdpC [Burkholderiales bacterium]